MSLLKDVQQILGQEPETEKVKPPKKRFRKKPKDILEDSEDMMLPEEVN